MPDRRCKRIFAMLSEYLDGELPVKNCRQLKRHLQGCKPCLAYLDSLKITIQACQRYRLRQVPQATAHVRAALLKAVRKG